MTMTLMTSLIILLSIIDSMTSLTIYRDVIDKIPGNCTALRPTIPGINKTTCSCETTRKTIVSKFYDYGSPMCQSQLDAAFCKISVTAETLSDTILITPNSSPNITLSGSGVSSITEIDVWNMKEDGEGVWKDISSLGKKYLKMVSLNVLTVSEFVKESWSGHALRVVYGGGPQCSVIKFEGRNKYPFLFDDFMKKHPTQKTTTSTEMSTSTLPSTTFSKTTTSKSVSLPTVSSQSKQSCGANLTVKTTGSLSTTKATTKTTTNKIMSSVTSKTTTKPKTTSLRSRSSRQPLTKATSMNKTTSPALITLSYTTTNTTLTEKTHTTHKQTTSWVEIVTTTSKTPSTDKLVATHARNSTIFYVTFLLLFFVVIAVLAMFLARRRANSKRNSKDIRVKIVDVEDEPALEYSNPGYTQISKGRDEEEEELSSPQSKKCFEEPAYKIDEFPHIKVGHYATPRPSADSPPSTPHENMYSEIPVISGNRIKTNGLYDYDGDDDAKESQSEYYSNIDVKV